MDTSSRTCFCDWFLPGGPSPLCLHPCFYSVQEVPSQGDANPCRVGLSQHQNLHPGCSPSHDECRRHHPYLAVGPRCLFPGGSKKVYDFWFTPSGHTAFCLYNFQAMGTLGRTILPPAQDGSSPKGNSSDTCLHQNFFSRCTSTRTSYTTTSMELSLSTLTSTVRRKKQKDHNLSVHLQSFRQRNARGVLLPFAWAWPWNWFRPHPSFSQQTGTVSVVFWGIWPVLHSLIALTIGSIGLRISEFTQNSDFFSFFKRRKWMKLFGIWSRNEILRILWSRNLPLIKIQGFLKMKSHDFWEHMIMIMIASVA